MTTTRHTPIPLVPGRLAFNADGIPFSPAFDDIYHSADGGLGQARHVFIGGNGLPERWRGRETFTIVETGFGIGLNFLATWQAFRADPGRPARLHFVSVEKHPFLAGDLRELHRRWPELASLSRELIAAWPLPMAGFHRLHLDHQRVTLTLLLGEAAELLPQLTATADAFFLDGFSPAKNPDLWSAAICRELARLAGPGATLATYTVASNVRDALAAAGFATEMRRGFARKREMLVGHWPANDGAASDAAARRAIVIGAGLAGTSCAERLAARGWQVEIIERHGAVAEEASGNPSAVLHPILNLDETPNARLSRAAFLYTLRHLNALEGEGLSLAWGRTGLLHIAVTREEELRFREIMARCQLPDALVRFVEADEAARLAGNRTGGPGLWFPAGAWLNPPSLCVANLARYPARIFHHLNCHALRLQKNGTLWTVRASDGAKIATASVVILANAADCNRFDEAGALPFSRVRGQITCLPALSGRRLDIAVTGAGYISTMPGGGYCVGATFQRDDTGTEMRVADHETNLAALHAMLPGFATGIDATALDGRVAFRSATPDRLPMFGELQPGLYVAAGLGARGLLWAPLGAELLASIICGESLPLEESLVRAIDPLRFASRLHA